MGATPSCTADGILQVSMGGHQLEHDARHLPRSLL